MSRHRGFIFAGTFTLAMLAACADPQQVQDEFICETSFLRDRQWARIKPEAPEVLELQRQFLSPSREAPVWFVRAKTAEFGSCAMKDCDARYCYYHVQIYTKTDGRWNVSAEYDLAPRRLD